MPRMQWSGHTLTGEVLAERLVWLLHMRWLAAAGMVVLTAGARWLLNVGVATWPIFSLAAVVAGYNAALWFWQRRLPGHHGQEHAESGPVRHIVNAQIALDLLVLTLVLHFAGGVTNPAAIFMVFHMAIAAILLSRRDAFMQAGWASLLYVSMVVLEMIIPSLHYPLSGYPAASLYQAPLFVAAQCAVLVITLWLIAYFTSNISARLRRAYRHLARASDELGELEFAKSRFLRVAAHQLRGPLAAVYSVLQALEADGENLNDQQKRLLDRVRTRCKDMIELVNEMLALSQLKEAAAAQEERSAVSLSAALKSVVALHAASAAQKQVELTLSIAEDSQVLCWDKALDDVFGNLVGNAVKYTPAGGRVQVQAQRRARFAVVTVRDTGIGIPQASQAHMFEEFFRAANARKFAGGTGLGLNIVKEIVERLGGTISFTSAENQGTTFTVELPAR